MKSNILSNYKNDLNKTLNQIKEEEVSLVCELLSKTWLSDRNIFICGNGGSAGNANHIANDFLYIVSKNFGRGMKFESLSSNSSVITCLANDISYDDIYSEQIKTKARENDLIFFLSGSGNSKNIIKGINIAKEMNIVSVGVFGFDGGICKNLVDHLIHFNINNMQVCEDLQLSFFHICMKIISENSMTH